MHQRSLFCLLLADFVAPADNKGMCCYCAGEVAANGQAHAGDTGAASSSVAFQTIPFIQANEWEFVVEGGPDDVQGQNLTRNPREKTEQNRNNNSI